MPIYEFYCANCHTVYSFLSKTIDTAKRPDCPRCGRPKLDRRMSRFAVSTRRSEPAAEEETGPICRRGATRRRWSRPWKP